ncbi:hypothetical protein DYBT9623_05481 [Dyadobacter sp. CECT 9623]|uniref:Transposase n=1 Tax=Dyadobacter linearis TaxID=2823330 RepID=A0ABN7RGF2_9BACT|nr:hypothetical protein DYBT9623_05481 [Dyadobacter sp. CECT 9623]
MSRLKKEYNLNKAIAIFRRLSYIYGCRSLDKFKIRGVLHWLASK